MSQLIRYLAERETCLDERLHDDPVEDDAELVERAVAGLEGYGHALIQRAATAAPEDKDRLFQLLLAYVVYEAAPRVDPADLRTMADLVGRKMERAEGNA